MAVAELVGDQIVIDTVWNEKESIKKIPGATWDKDAKTWTLPLSWSACNQLRGIFGTALGIGSELRQWAKDQRAIWIDPAMALRDRLEADDLITQGPDINPDLYKFQVGGVRFLRTVGSALLGDEMGTGKTIQALETMRLIQLAEGNALPAVIVCPNSVKPMWAREARKWFKFATPYVIEGTAAKRREQFKKAALDPTALVIINFEGVRSHSRVAGFGSIALKKCKACTPTGFAGVKEATCEVHPRELNTIPFQTVIVDEAHRIKDPKAKQTRAIWAVGANKTVLRRIAMTGTPIGNSPEDLWSIMHFVAPLEYPRKSAFVDRYCLATFNAWGGMDVKGLTPENKAEFHRIFDPRFRRMTKDMVLPQLPPKIRARRTVLMGDKQKKAYDQVADGMITRLDDGSVLIAKGNLAVQTRLIQFSSAYMEQTGTDLDGKPIYKMCDPSPKIDAFVDILDEMGTKQVVACAESIQLINLTAARLDKLGVSYAKITGEVSQWERDSQLADFQAGKLQVMLFTIKAGGTGLTMTAADTIVFLQRSWSMIENKQSEDRVHRIGSEIHESIQLIDLVAEDSIEEEQIDALWEKAERLEEITRDRARLEAAGLSTAALDIEEDAILNTKLGGL